MAVKTGPKSNVKSGIPTARTPASATGTTLSATGGKAYARDRAYVAASDTKGHSKKLWVELSPTLQALISQRMGDNPEFKSPQDVVRNAIVHDLVWSANNPGADVDPMVLYRHELMMEVERRMFLQTSLEKDLDDMEAAVITLVENEDWDSADHILDNAQVMLDRFEHNTGQAKLISNFISWGITTMRDGRTGQTRRRR